MHIIFIFYFDLSVATQFNFVILTQIHISLSNMADILTLTKLCDFKAVSVQIYKSGNTLQQVNSQLVVRCNI